MKSTSLRNGGVRPRVWLVLAMVALAAVLGHFDHASRQAEYLGEAAVMGVFLAFFLPWMFPGHARGILLTLSILATSAAVLIPVGTSVITGGMSRWERKNLASEKVAREELFAGHNVMVLVAHPDDEVLMLGGVIEEYVQADSRVTLVYATDGDHFGKGTLRRGEALSLAEYYGIPAENVVFLDRGEGFSEDERDSYRESIAALLRENRPDVIFCQDADIQFEHRALSFLFEAALGDLLRELPDYSPTVFKGFSYDSSWSGESFVPGAVTAPDPGERMSDNVQYRTSEAIRFPVSSDAVSPVSPEQTSLDEALEIYASQDASLRSDRVMRSERRLFLRRTDSVLYGAAVSSSSGNAEELTDFRVSYAEESFAALSPEMGENGWFPASDDEVKTVTIELCKPECLTSAVLYDNPSAANNILSATLITDTGKVYTVENMDPLGGATEIALSGEEVSSFTLTVDAWEGETPGLAELEAFTSPAPAFPLTKITDEEGRFAYKCLADGQCRLAVYSRDADSVSCRFETDNPALELIPDDGGVTVLCPAGESGLVRLLAESGETLDSVAVASPDGLAEKLLPYTDAMAHLSLRGQYRYYRSLWHIAETKLGGYAV